MSNEGSDRMLLLFLSHAGADTEAARALKQRIEATPAARERGLKVWFDKDDLRAGEEWQAQLEEAIGRRATAFAVYVGSNGVINWVEREVRLALSRATSDNGRFPFIPILAAPTDTSALPGFALQFQGVRDVESRPEEFQKLVAAVLGGAEAGKLALEKEPFFGLKAIDETRSHLFFGRERETQELVERLHGMSLLMVTGDSGSGKSSLVRAGLVPSWRGGALAELEGRRPGEAIWHVVEMRPTASPRRSLGDAVFNAAVSLGRSAEDCGTYKKWVMGDDAEPRRDGLRCGLPADRTRTLLVVDQFEELFTLAPPDQRPPFVDLLLDLAAPKDPAFAVVLTMRRDYYNLYSEFPALYQRLEADDRRARYLIGRMHNEDLRRVMTEPLKLAGVPEGDREALATSVLGDVGERPGDLALVQFALTETWHQRSQYQGDLLQTYAAVGRVEGALARAAESVYAQALGGDKHESEIAALFIRLVRLGDTGGATRRLARRRELDDKGWALIQTLAGEAGNRLVLIGGTEAEETAEIAHEALVTQWPRFQRWLQAAAKDKRALDALIERAASWAAKSDQAKSQWLATGADRESFAQLAKEHPEWLSADERAFVDASNAAYQDQLQREENSRKRLKRLTLSAVVAAALAIVVAGFAFWQRKEADHQRKVAVAQ